MSQRFTNLLAYTVVAALLSAVIFMAFFARDYRSKATAYMVVTPQTASAATALSGMTESAAFLGSTHVFDTELEEDVRARQVNHTTAELSAVRVVRSADGVLAVESFAATDERSVQLATSGAYSLMRVMGEYYDTASEYSVRVIDGEARVSGGFAAQNWTLVLSSVIGFFVTAIVFVIVFLVGQRVDARRQSQRGHGHASRAYLNLQSQQQLPVSFAASQTADENYMQDTYREDVPSASAFATHPEQFDASAVDAVELTPEALEAKAEQVNERLFGTGLAKEVPEAPTTVEDYTAGADLDAAISSLLEEQFEEHADVAVTEVEATPKKSVAKTEKLETVAKKSDVKSEEVKPSQQVGKIAKNVQESLEAEEQKVQKSSPKKGVQRWRDKARELAGDMSAQTSKAAKKATDATGKVTKSAAKAVSSTVEKAAKETKKAAEKMVEKKDGNATSDKKVDVPEDANSDKKKADTSVKSVSAPPMNLPIADAPANLPIGNDAPVPVGAPANLPVAAAALPAEESAPASKPAPMKDDGPKPEPTKAEVKQRLNELLRGKPPKTD